MPGGPGAAVERPLHRRHIHDELVAGVRAQHGKIEARIQHEGRNGVEQMHLEKFDRWQLRHENPPRFGLAQIGLLHVLVELARGEELVALFPLLDQQRKLRQLGGVGQSRGLGRRGSQQRVADLRGQLSASLGLIGQQVRVELGRAAHRLTRIVDDEWSRVSGGRPTTTSVSPDSPVWSPRERGSTWSPLHFSVSLT